VEVVAGQVPDARVVRGVQAGGEGDDLVVDQLALEAGTVAAYPVGLGFGAGELAADGLATALIFTFVPAGTVAPAFGSVDEMTSWAYSADSAVTFDSSW
jgi:hypothetical protein